MQKKMINHGIIVTAILIAVFVTAAFTGVKSDKDTSKAPLATSIAQIDHANNSGGRMIAENTVPMAATPFGHTDTSSILIVAVAFSAIMSGIVIYEEYKDSRA